MEKFSKKEALSFGWQKTKENFPFFLGLLIIAGIIYYFPSIMADRIKDSAKILYVVISLASAVVNWLIQLGLIRIFLKFCDAQKAKIADLFAEYRLLLKFIGATIIYSLIVLGGFILLIIPGIIWSVRFGFFSYLIVDKNMGVIESLKKSREITKGATWELLVFGLLTFLVILLGVLALLVGLFAALPTAMLAWAFVYRRLLAASANPQI